MKFLIKIQTDSELIGYEAIALGFTLASFDHEVQFYLTGESYWLLTERQSRLYGMIQSLELYDLPKAWAKFDNMIEFDEVIADVLIDLDAEADLSAFDGVLEF